MMKQNACTLCGIHLGVYFVQELCFKNNSLVFIYFVKTNVSKQGKLLNATESCLQLYNFTIFSFYRIHSINGNTFLSQVNLHSLKLNHNIISDISSQALAGLSVLSSLHFGFNRLESLEANLFNNCSSLVDLYLQGNMLRQVPEAVRQIKLLKTLDLGDNMLTNSLTADSLTGLHHLYGLRLAGNGLRTLNASMFKSVAKLQVLNLADNQLSKLDEVRNMFFLHSMIYTHNTHIQ